jgi:hypothetical protein
MQNEQNTTTMMIHLQGTAGSRIVKLNGKLLNPGPSQAIWNHSPDGFNWGYSGSGPAQLALAIMLEIAPEKVALKNYQNFKDELAKLPMDQSFDVEINAGPYIQQQGGQS